TEAELTARRARGRVQAPKSEQERYIDVETTPSWNGRKAGWTISQTVSTNAVPKNGNAESAMTKTNLLSRETEEIIATSSNELKILRGGGNASGSLDYYGDMAKISLPSETSPVAVLQLPQKLNGERDLVTLQDGSTNVSVVPNAPNTTITVDRTDDPAGALL